MPSDNNYSTEPACGVSIFPTISVKVDYVRTKVTVHKSFLQVCLQIVRQYQKSNSCHDLTTATSSHGKYLKKKSRFQPKKEPRATLQRPGPEFAGCLSSDPVAPLSSLSLSLALTLSSSLSMRVSFIFFLNLRRLGLGRERPATDTCMRQRTVGAMSLLDRMPFSPVRKQPPS